MTGVLLAGAVASWAMVGVIWMVQIVQYPMLAAHGPDTAAAAARDHQHRISFVVGPLMAVEGATALILLFDRPATMSGLSALTAAALLGVALLSTTLVQVPLHRRIAERYDPVAARRLVHTNWVRTAAWSVRALLLASVVNS